MHGLGCHVKFERQDQLGQNGKPDGLQALELFAAHEQDVIVPFHQRVFQARPEYEHGGDPIKNAAAEISPGILILAA